MQPASIHSKVQIGTTTTNVSAASVMGVVGLLHLHWAKVNSREGTESVSFASVGTDSASLTLHFGQPARFGSTGGTGVEPGAGNGASQQHRAKSLSRAEQAHRLAPHPAEALGLKAATAGKNTADVSWLNDAIKATIEKRQDRAEEIGMNLAAKHC